jgi:hypothetical protein
MTDNLSELPESHEEEALTPERDPNPSGLPNADDVDRSTTSYETSVNTMPQDSPNRASQFTAFRGLEPSLIYQISKIDIDVSEWKKLLARDLSLTDLRHELISIYMRRGEATDSKLDSSKGPKTRPDS